ncbi:MAG: prepilin-type N-terminal cleavage/methylation domain-containing protein [Microgenomates group bacterium]
MRKYASLPKVSGYTLIEILVGMTIIGLIFSFGYVSYRDFARRQALLGTARKLKVDLRLAQEQALAGKKPDSVACNTEGALNGYDFYAESAGSYKIQANCAGGLVDIKTVQISSDVSLSSNPNRFTFKVLGKGVNLSADALIILTQTVTGNTQNITVSPEGEIK